MPSSKVAKNAFSLQPRLAGYGVIQRAILRHYSLPLYLFAALLCCATVLEPSHFKGMWGAATRGAGLLLKSPASAATRPADISLTELVLHADAAGEPI